MLHDHATWTCVSVPGQSFSRKLMWLTRLGKRQTLSPDGDLLPLHSQVSSCLSMCTQEFSSAAEALTLYSALLMVVFSSDCVTHRVDRAANGADASSVERGTQGPDRISWL